MEIIVSFGALSDGGASRNQIEGKDPEILLDLFDTDEQNTGVGFELVTGSGSSPVSIGAGNTQGIEDAFWVEPWMNNSATGALVSGDMVCKFNSLPAGQYVIETYGISSTATRLLGSSVFGSDPLSHSVEANISRTNRHEPVDANAGGEIDSSVYEDGTTGSGNALLAAVRIYSVDNSASLTPTNPPQGGELFQFSGSNYSAQPTGPMTFTQGTRVISRAVTISNWNATDGSFTGVTDTALPGVPAAGASDTPALLYGEPVTISLPDPGA